MQSDNKLKVELQQREKISRINKEKIFLGKWLLTVFAISININCATKEKFFLINIFSERFQLQIHD